MLKDFGKEVADLVKEYSDIMDTVPKEFKTLKEKMAYLKGYTDATRDYSKKIKQVSLGTYKESD